MTNAQTQMRYNYLDKLAWRVEMLTRRSGKYGIDVEDAAQIVGATDEDVIAACHPDLGGEIAVNTYDGVILPRVFHTGWMNPEEHTVFLLWLAQQRIRDDDIGSLGREVFADISLHGTMHPRAGESGVEHAMLTTTRYSATPGVLWDAFDEWFDVLDRISALARAAALELAEAGTT